ncbi:hypothetical protein ACIGO9_31135 [Nocardia asteroides]|uniref:hypothetical protein n=1 Tax=Nocardia asteroides TaxID=1824 RepID=UPI0037C5E6CF
MSGPESVGRFDRLRLPRVRWRTAIEMVMVFVSTSVAALTIMQPIRYSSLSDEVLADLLVFDIPRVMTGGALFAVITAAITAAAGSIRIAWWTAIVALIAILINHGLVLPLAEDAHLGSLSVPTLSFLDAVSAGVAFGALAVGAWVQPLLRAAFLFGAGSAVVTGDFTPPALGADTVGGTMPMWFIAVSVVALAFLDLTRPHRRFWTPDDAISMAPIFAAVLSYSAVLVTTLVVAARGSSAGTVLACGVVLLGTTVMAALILPGRDGVLLLSMAAYSVAGSLVVTGPRTAWVEVLAFVTVAAGFVVGLRTRSALAGASSVIVLAVYTLVDGSLYPPTALTTAIGCGALGLVGGFSVGACVPRDAASATVGLSILFIPSVGIALADSAIGHLDYAGSWYRTTDIDPGPMPSVVAIGLSCGLCAAVALLVRRRGENS